VLVALVVALAPAPARASGGLTVTGYVFPSIVVTGNGHRYTGVSALGYAWAAGVDISTGTSGRIKEWQVWPALTIEGQPTFELKVYGHREWYPSASDPWPRPKSVKKTLVLLFPDVLIKDYVVSACNDNADRLRQQGQSTTPLREATTGANREVSFTDTLDFSKTAGGLWIEQGGVIGPGGDQAGPYAGSFQIVGQSVQFESSPAPYSFTCTGQAPGAIKP
jgi:hypothetical protein